MPKLEYRIWCDGAWGPWYWVPKALAEKLAAQLGESRESGDDVLQLALNHEGSPFGVMEVREAA